MESEAVVDGTEDVRVMHRRAVREAAERSRTADTKAKQARDDFYATLADAHGAAMDGKLTHAELAVESGWGRGWVRLAIANWHKRQARTG